VQDDSLAHALELLYTEMQLDVQTLRDMPFDEFMAIFTPLHRAFDKLTVPLAANPDLIYQQAQQVSGLYLRLEAALSMVTEARNWMYRWTREAAIMYGRDDERYHDYITKRDALDRIAQDLERQHKALSRVFTMLEINR